LPEPASRDATGREQIPREPSRRAPALPVRAPVEARAPASGNMVEVQRGDTLYGIAKRHRVAISELMSVNNLQNPTIFPGQKLALPGGRRPVRPRRGEAVAVAPPTPRPALPPARTPREAPVAAVPPEPEVAEAPSTVATGGSWTGSHTVSPRDSLYVLSKRYNVKIAELQAANGITDPARLRAGTVLKVPGPSDAAGHAAAPAPHAAGAPGTKVPRSIVADAPPSGPAPRPTIINATQDQPEPEPERVAVAAPRTPTMTDAVPDRQSAPAPSKATLAGKFRWPVKGRIITGFGPRGDKSHNDGINILVPKGTAVAAAESGVVAYAGSELKGYGNLILVRHEGNWVSAYAHNDSLLVKRGDRVDRGQVIAKAGATGAVDQPQVHFELRQGSKPVDPMPHLER
jgi:murein DD-endopeptidase MepM/ murein hydrolase activator NlpD